MTEQMNALSDYTLPCDEIPKIAGIKGAYNIYCELCKETPGMDVYLNSLLAFIKMEDNERKGNAGREQIKLLFKDATSLYDVLSAKAAAIRKEIAPGLNDASQSTIMNFAGMRKVLMKYEVAIEVINVTFVMFLFSKRSNDCESINDIARYKDFIQSSWKELHLLSPDEAADLCMERNQVSIEDERDTHFGVFGSLNFDTFDVEGRMAFIDSIFDFKTSQEYLKCAIDVYKALIKKILLCADSEELREFYFATVHLLLMSASSVNSKIEYIRPVLIRVLNVTDNFSLFMFDRREFFNKELYDICATMVELMEYYRSDGSLHKDPINYFKLCFAQKLAEAAVIKRNTKSGEDLLEYLTEFIYEDDNFSNMVGRTSIVSMFTATDKQLEVISDNVLSSVFYA